MAVFSEDCFFWMYADKLSISYCLIAKSCLFCHSMDCVSHQASLSMGFPRQNTGVGCHFLLHQSITY